MNNKAMMGFGLIAALVIGIGIGWVLPRGQDKVLASQQRERRVNIPMVPAAPTESPVQTNDRTLAGPAIATTVPVSQATPTAALDNYESARAPSWIGTWGQPWGMGDRGIEIKANGIFRHFEDMGGIQVYGR